jgi:putative ABC transport system ATP-binding protein
MVLGDEVIYDNGWKVRDLRALRRDKIGFVFQAPYLIPFLDVTDNVALIPMLANIPNGEARAKALELLTALDVQHRAKAMPAQLSGGEQQRLALGKLLLLNPKILLLDEPTKGIDPFFKRTLADILKRLCSQGVTILMVTHDIEFSATFADRCAMFFDGEIVSVGEPKEFFAGNSFYTTSANRLANAWFPEAITSEEVAKKCEEILMKKK